MSPNIKTEVKGFKSKRKNWFEHNVKSYRLNIGKGFLYYNSITGQYDMFSDDSPILTRQHLIYLKGLPPHEGFWEAWKLHNIGTLSNFEYETYA